MVVGAFPAAKLASLLLKQISKPIANVIKSRAKSSPFFRTYVCMPPAQFYNWCEVQTKMWILNLGKPVNIPVLNEAMAIELGANLLGEGIIFVIAAGVLIAEYNRSSNKEAAKEASKDEEVARLNSTLMDLYLTTEQQATEIRELKRLVYDLDSRVVQKPWVPKKDVPVPEPEPPKKKPPPPLIYGIKPSSEQDSTGGLLPVENPKGSDNIVKSSDSHTKNFHKTPNGLIFKGLWVLENEIWGEDQERQLGIVSKALNNFYKDIYNVPLTV